MFAYYYIVKDKIKGTRNHALTKPPIIKQIVATRDGHWRLDRPMMA
jgi:hypothetical protein